MSEWILVITFLTAIGSPRVEVIYGFTTLQTCAQASLKFRWPDAEAKCIERK